MSDSWKHGISSHQCWLLLTHVKCVSADQKILEWWSVKGNLRTEIVVDKRERETSGTDVWSSNLKERDSVYDSENFRMMVGQRKLTDWNCSGQERERQVAQMYGPRTWKKGTALTIQKILEWWSVKGNLRTEIVMDKRERDMWHRFMVLEPERKGQRLRFRKF